MNKNKELTENVYNACKQWLENYNCQLDKWQKTCQEMPCYFVCRHVQITKESARRYLENR
jgi:hypothetical protein